MLRVCASNSCGVPTLHIPHIPHQPTNQPTPYPIHISCALQIFNVIKLRDANFAADAAAYKSSTRRQKRQRAKSPKGPQLPPYSLKTAKATAASKIALNSPKKKQLISLPAVPIEQQQQNDEASASSSASCVALREARRKICAYNKLPK